MNPIPKIHVGEVRPVLLPNEMMAQIGVGIANLLKTGDGYCHIIAAMDYFSKWPES